VLSLRRVPNGDSSLAVADEQIESERERKPDTLACMGGQVKGGCYLRAGSHQNAAEKKFSQIGGGAGEH
jgi:hypothetical protein